MDWNQILLILIGSAIGSCVGTLLALWLPWPMYKEFDETESSNLR